MLLQLSKVCVESTVRLPEGGWRWRSSPSTWLLTDGCTGKPQSSLCCLLALSSLVRLINRKLCWTICVRCVRVPSEYICRWLWRFQGLRAVSLTLLACLAADKLVARLYQHLRAAMTTHIHDDAAGAIPSAVQQANGGNNMLSAADVNITLSAGCCNGEPTNPQN